MGRIQAYLPDDLHEVLRRSGLSASRLLQDAVRREVRRAELEAEVDAYLADLDGELGPADAAERAAAATWVAEVEAAATTIHDVRERERAS